MTNTSDKDKLFILTIAQTPGVGVVRLRLLLDVFSSFEEIESASPNQIASIEGIGEKVAQGIYAFWKNKEKLSLAKNRAAEQFELADKWQVSMVTYKDEIYPISLAQLNDAPALLFVRGQISTLSLFSIAVVGTRVPSDYGKRTATDIATYLAEKNVCIVSGFAYGIDTIAHSVACQKGTPTIAMLGSGVDNPYTDTKNKLTPLILEKGAIISEEFIGTKPTPENFPKRNRVISGLSKGVVVVESDIDGGAMITARYALEQNREVFAVPGNIYSKKSFGTNKLIQQGAKCVSSPQDILEDFPKLNERTTANGAAIKKLINMSQPINMSHLNDDEKIIVMLLGNGARHIDSLIEDANIDASEISVALFMLEGKNIIKETQGKYYQLVV